MAKDLCEWLWEGCTFQLFWQNKEALIAGLLGIVMPVLQWIQGNYGLAFFLAVMALIAYDSSNQKAWQPAQNWYYCRN